MLKITRTTKRIKITIQISNTGRKEFVKMKSILTFHMVESVLLSKMINQEIAV